MSDSNPTVAATGTARPASEAPAPPARERRGPPVPVIVFGLLLLVGAVFGFQRWRWGLTHVSTDNAQIEGHLIPVSPKVGGYVVAVNAEENTRVGTDSLLVQIDDREYRAKLAQAEGDLASALANAGQKGRAGQAEAQLAAARAQVAQAEANATRARNDVERYRTLAARQIVSRQQLDAATATSLAANAQLDAMRKQVQAAEAALQGAGARVEAARAARDQAALNIGFTRVRAPDSGLVSRRNVEVGQLVQAGQPLMSVVTLHDVWVVANLKETEIADVNPGDKVEIEVDAYGKHKFAGHVESLSGATGAKFSLLPPDNATGNFTKVVQRVPVRIAVDGPRDPERPLRPGMSVLVTVTTK